MKTSRPKSRWIRGCLCVPGRIAGSNFEISYDSFSLYAEYKYFATEDVNVEPAAANGNVSHSILAGLKYNFYLRPLSY